MAIKGSLPPAFQGGDVLGSSVINSGLIKIFSACGHDGQSIPFKFYPRALTGRTPHPRNGTRRNGPLSVGRMAETRSGKSLQRVRTAARTDSLVLDVRHRGATREFDRACPARLLGRAPTSASLWYTDCPATRTIRGS